MNFGVETDENFFGEVPVSVVALSLINSGKVRLEDIISVPSVVEDQARELHINIDSAPASMKYSMNCVINSLRNRPSLCKEMFNCECITACIRHTFYLLSPDYVMELVDKLAQVGINRNEPFSLIVRDLCRFHDDGHRGDELVYKQPLSDLGSFVENATQQDLESCLNLVEEMGWCVVVTVGEVQEAFKRGLDTLKLKPSEIILENIKEIDYAELVGDPHILNKHWIVSVGACGIQERRAIQFMSDSKTFSRNEQHSLVQETINSVNMFNIPAVRKFIEQNKPRGVQAFVQGL